MAPVLGYWKIRGLGVPVQYLLEYAGEKYELKTYAPEDPAVWLKDKESNEVGLEHPNLPFYIDGKTKLTQSIAILRHLARKHGLIAKTEEDIQEQDMVDGMLIDMLLFWVILMYKSENFDADKDIYREQKCKPTLEHWNTVLTKRSYLVADYLTYSDFYFFERLDAISTFFPGILDHYSKLKDYHTRMANLKGVKEFRQSEYFRSVEHKFHVPAAKWGK